MTLNTPFTFSIEQISFENPENLPLQLVLLDANGSVVNQSNSSQKYQLQQTGSKFTFEALTLGEYPFTFALRDSISSDLYQFGITFKMKGAPAVANGYGITYHGGQVMEGVNRIYYIWYGNWAGNTAVEILTDLANNLSGSPYWNINSSYSTSSQKITNLVEYGGATTDNYSYGTTLTDSSIYYIVNNAITSGKLPADDHGVYFVLSSKDVAETSGFCKSYCGYHTYNYGGGMPAGKHVKYAFVGDSARCMGTCAVQSKSPNGNPGADGMASVIAHEFAEAVTDPALNAWYDTRGEENADKCSWNFGTKTAGPGGYYWNVKLGARQYYLQSNWVNAQKYVNGRLQFNGYCDLSY